MDVCDSFAGTQAGVGIPSVPPRGCEIFGRGELTHWPSFFLRSTHTHIYTHIIGSCCNYSPLLLCASLLLLLPMLIGCVELAEL